MNYFLNSEIYCLSLLEDNTRYITMINTNKFVPQHEIFPAFKFYRGSIGCAMSYKIIMQNAIKQKIDKIMVFEDDCIFNYNFKNIYDITLDFLKKMEWDIFNFYSCIINYEDILKAYKYKGVIYLNIKNCVGMVCNIYNNSMFENITNYPFKEAILDNDNSNTLYHIDRRFAIKKDISIFITYPYSVDLLDIYSTTTGNSGAYQYFIDHLNISYENINKFLKNNDIIEIY